MEKNMYALTYCYEGVDDSYPYASTIAVSDDIEKLKTKLAECVAEDTEIDEDDEWRDDCNYNVTASYDGREAYLQHRKNINLYASYKIHHVNVL